MSGADLLNPAKLSRIRQNRLLFKAALQGVQEAEPRMDSEDED